MKNLFVIAEEEKNRILGLHESATKNLYLVNETASIPEVVGVYSDVANCLGFDINGGTSNCKRVMIFDGQMKQNLISNVCDSGYIDFKVENDWKNTTIPGSWVVSDKNVTVTMSDGTKFTGTLTPGSLKEQVTSWLVKQTKFNDFVKGLGSEVQNIWKSWGGGDSQGGAQGGSGLGNQGWDLAMVMKKYPCLYGNDFAETKVYPTPYGDVIKLNLGKNKSGQSVYGKMFLQDGYMVNWESNVRIGKDDQYMACKNNTLSFQTGKNVLMTDPSGKPQMESLNKVGNLVKEAINAEVINFAGGSGSGSSGGNRVNQGNTGPSNAQKVQTKLKELDPNTPQTGKMDQATINKIMNLLTQGVKTPEPTTTSYQVQQSSSNAQSED